MDGMIDYKCIYSVKLGVYLPGCCDSVIFGESATLLKTFVRSLKGALLWCPFATAFCETLSLASLSSPSAISLTETE